MIANYEGLLHRLFAYCVIQIREIRVLIINYQPGYRYVYKCLPEVWKGNTNDYNLYSDIYLLTNDIY